MINRQEAFDKAVAGLASQGFHRSLSFGGVTCMYRDGGRSGKKCAVGWLIPDELYSPTIEGACPGSFLSRNSTTLHDIIDKVFGEKVEREDLEFLASLQQCHDRAPRPEEMRHKLWAFGYRFGLTLPEVLKETP